MARAVKSRSYDNSGRQAAARETRRAVVAAARELFLAQGYAATTLTAVAQKAGVSVQTVYAQFGNKPAIVKQIADEAIVGDDEPIPVADRPEVQVQLAEPDPHKRIRMHARDVASRMPRLEPVDRMLRSAAEVDPEMRAQLKDSEAGRLAGMTEMASFYDARGELVVPLGTAAQRISALMSPELYRITVVDQGWSPEEYADWLGELLAASVLKPRGRRR